MHARCKAGRGVLHYAAKSNSTALVDLLLSSGVDIEVRDNLGSTPLSYALHDDAGSVVLRKILDRGADQESTESSGHTPLADAILFKRPLAVQVLAPVSDLTIRSGGWNILFMCFEESDRRCLAMLLPHFADLEAPALPPDGSDDTFVCQTLLHLACHWGCHAMVTALLRRGASRTTVTNDGGTALHYAASYGYLSCCCVLLGQPGAFRMTPAVVNMADQRGWTALHDAARHGHVRVCGLLIQAGASLDATKEDGKTPLMVAQEEHPDNALLLTLLAGDWVGPLPGTACERCATVPDSALLHCSACQSVSYCCPRCAAADWPRHAVLCKETRRKREARLRPPAADEAAPPAGPE